METLAEGAPAATAPLPDWLRRALAGLPSLRRQPEPLERSAPLALDWAERRCQGCGAYHGLWQYRRMTGGVAALGVDGAIYQAVIAALRRDEGLTRILISATADYALQAVVRDAFAGPGEAPGVPDITVVDRCATPLLLNAWLAAERGGSVETQQGHLLEADLGGPYDLATSHSLFFWFSPEERLRLAARWFAALRPGGRVMLSNRVTPSERPRAEPKMSTDALLDELRRSAGRFEPQVLQRLLALAPDLQRTWGGHAVASLDALLDPIRRAGFEIEAVLEANEVLPQLADVDSQPGRGTAGGRRHLVLARRPR